MAKKDTTPDDVLDTPPAPQVNNNVKDRENEDQSETPHTMDSLFGQRDQLSLGESGTDGTHPPSEKESEEPLPAEEEAESRKGEKLTLKADEKKDAVDASELDELRERLRENQRFARQSRQKMKELTQGVQGLIEDGALSEEEAQGLLKRIEDGTNEAEESEALPFVSLFKIANPELAQMAKYSNDDQLQQKAEAFDFLISISPKDKQEDILETLMGLKDDPIALTRKMLELGEETYNTSYKDIQDAGGMSDYLVVQRDERSKLQKKIDKLEKKLALYEDYDKPTQRIAEQSDLSSNESSLGTIDSLFAERDRPRVVTR